MWHDLIARSIETKCHALQSSQINFHYSSIGDQSTTAVDKKKKVTFLIKTFESFKMCYRTCHTCSITSKSFHCEFTVKGFGNDWADIPHFKALKKFLERKWPSLSCAPLIPPTTQEEWLLFHKLGCPHYDFTFFVLISRSHFDASGLVETNLDQKKFWL